MAAIWKPTSAMWHRMFKATQLKHDYAVRLLDRMTPAELRLWAELSQENVGPRVRPICPWRCQVVIKGWIVDFYNDYTLTVIEVDGSIHDQAEQQAKDAIKDEALRHFGLRVIRVTNAEVLRDAPALVQHIHGYS